MIAAQGASPADMSGLTGFIADVVASFGEIGVGVLTLVETVFPPVPSELILPLAGFLAQQGRLNVVLLLVTATLGGVLGALVLYWLGRKLGEERAVRLLARLPLVDRSDFERSAEWFRRHGRAAVFFGRLIPGVRSLISLPAGAEHMPLPTFMLFTAAGTLLWNAVLVALGYLLGTQYHLVDQYARYFDLVLYAAAAAFVLWLIVRRVRRKRHAHRD